MPYQTHGEDAVVGGAHIRLVGIDTVEYIQHLALGQGVGHLIRQCGPFIARPGVGVAVEDAHLAGIIGPLLVLVLHIAL